MKRILSSLALIICAAALTQAQTDKQMSANANGEQAVVQATNDLLAAEEKGDRDALDRLIADDFTGTGVDGNTVTKHMLVPAAPAPANGLSLRAADLKTHLFNDVAVVTGRGLPKLQAANELRFTFAFVYRQARWQLVVAHLSGVPAQP